MPAYLGLDLGGTQIRSLVAEAGERPRVLARDTRPTPRTGPDDVVAQIAASARRSMSDAGLTTSDVIAGCCSAPGPLDHRTGIVHQAPNLVGMVEFPLADRLSRALDGTRVYVDHDTKVAAIGEGLVGAAIGVHDFVYVTVSTGIGGAVVNAGRLLRGVGGTAGEIGHWPVALEGPRCGCGSYGCVESFASGGDLAAQFGTPSAEAVFAAAERGDRRAVTLVERAAAALEALGIGLVNVFNPSLIVVGGSVAQHQPEHVLGSMRRGIATRAFRVPAQQVHIVPPALGADVSLVGAVLAARERAAGRGEWFL
ncbi:MAG TPA: ROK family protein [Candidatus Limnocylindria bacterium]|nr:ROK family protein [Candidatus Limnocylindria bacterium]